MIRSFALILALIVVMGSQGREAFSRLSGLDILTGYYDLQDGGIARIHAEGVDKSGVKWKVFCPWKNGYPEKIIWYDPEIKL